MWLSNSWQMFAVKLMTEHMQPIVLFSMHYCISSSVSNVTASHKSLTGIPLNPLSSTSCTDISSVAQTRHTSFHTTVDKLVNFNSIKPTYCDESTSARDKGHSVQWYNSAFPHRWTSICAIQCFTLFQKCADSRLIGWHSQKRNNISVIRTCCIVSTWSISSSRAIPIQQQLQHTFRPRVSRTPAADGKYCSDYKIFNSSQVSGRQANCRQWWEPISMRNARQIFCAIVAYWWASDHSPYKLFTCNRQIARLRSVSRMSINIIVADLL